MSLFQAFEGAHSYFGTITTVQEAQVILEASKRGLLPRVTRRLTDDERIQFVKPGACFCWEEEEAGIRRWTDHIKWTPSRVSGAFLTYLEVPPRGDATIIKQSFSSIDPQTNCKMHLIAYNSKAAQRSGTLRSPLHDPMLQAVFQASLSSSREGGHATDLPRRPASASSSSSSSSADTRSPPMASATLPSRFGRHPSFSAAKLSHRRSHSSLHEARSKVHSATDADRDRHIRDRPSTANSDGDRPPLLSSQSFDAARINSGSANHTSGSSRISTPPTSMLSNVPARGTAAWPFAYPGISSTASSSNVGPKWDRDLHGPHKSASTSSLPIPSQHSISSETQESSPAPSTHGRSRSSTSLTTSLTQPSPLWTDSFHGSSQPPQVPTPPGSAGTSRQLAPYNELASGMTSTASPPGMASLISPLRGTFLDDDDEHEAWNPDNPKSEGGPRLPDQQRGSEDERQLRLLDRRI
ncbi:BQ2448_4936 [Microbotryum intermedium]|uniref:BQ2448_4936 protein n=1 Tax=Microbotryum intermedium TaxID=269621 RepID=A0A238FEJ2_9BASI|nr:BQ2448_4936 [Microbotryum intermedium]